MVSTQMAWARFSARPASRPQASAQSRTRSTAGARAGWWKPRATGSGSTTGWKARPPRVLASSSAASASARLLERGPEAAQGGGRAAHDDAARAVDRGDGGSVLARGGRDEEVLELRGGGAGDGEHGGLVVLLAVGNEACTTSGDGAGGTDEASDRKQFDVTAHDVAAVAALACAVAASGERGDAEDALAVADGGDRAERGQVEPLVAQLVEGGELGEQHAGQRQAAVLEVTARGDGAVLEPAVRLERAGEGSGDLLADGLDQSRRLLDERADPVGALVLLDQVAQGAEPVGALPAEGHGELLAGAEPIGQGLPVGGGRGVLGSTARGGLSHMRSTSCSPREPEIHLTFFTRLSSSFSIPVSRPGGGVPRTPARPPPDSRVRSRYDPASSLRRPCGRCHRRLQGHRCRDRQGPVPSRPRAGAGGPVDRAARGAGDGAAVRRRT